ncbi:PAS domain S-box-containing protein/diguanylate cyclase (GGDEF)-like protein [Nitrosomonas sp. Nm84]|uniref:PAS domain S-box protein n=1 Tax=Nitrosomonas sp. Nm84 TaxID=200124 RepID=UPI000D771146|nr:PAS domain S-box protein [Nitrosomonas sp. Nm84]PXW86175.1 PAS domain S-box-containing protein/diguanylate cyclase (GGDEF)-like protein [Nitrosomonas sp. Nm84]
MKKSDYLLDIIEHSGLLVYIKDDQGKFLFVNKKFEVIFDVHRNDILGKTSTELFLKNTAAILNRNDQAVMQSKKTIEYEDYLELAHDQRYFACSKFPLHSAFGRETTICTILTDITECKHTETTLKNTKIHYRNLFEESHDAQLILAPPTWDFQIANSAAVKMFGLSKTSDFTTLELNPWNISPERQPNGLPSLDATLAMIEIALRQGSHYFEWKYKRTNGEEFPCMVLLTRMQSDQLDYLQCSIRDITEQKQIESALRHSEERLSYALQAANDGLWDFNLETRIAYYSPRWKAMLGYGPDELTPDFDTWTVLMHPEDKDRALMLFDDYLEGLLETYKAEFRMRHKDGHWVYILSRGILARDNQGTLLSPRRIIGTHLDITEQKQSEALLRDSEKRYRIIFESSHDAKIVWSPRARKFVDSNPAALKIFGVSDIQTFTSLGFSDVSPERQGDGSLSSDESAKYIEEALQNGFSYFEWTHQRLNGEPFFSTVLLTRMEITEKFYILATVRDITKQKLIERKLHESEALYRKLFENSRDAMMIMSARTNKIVECNRAAIKMLKASNIDEINGLTPLQFSPEYQPEGCTSQEKFDQVLCATMRDGFHYFDWTHRRLDGEECPADVLIFPVELEGEPYLQCVHREITKQRRAENELRDSEARYRSLFEESRDAQFILAPPTWQFTMANQAAAEMFGLAKETDFSDLGLDPGSISPERQPGGRLSRDAAIDVIKTALHQGSHYFEWQHQRINGEEFPCMVLLTRMQSDNQIFLQGSVRDITRQKQAELALRHSEETLKRAQAVAHIGSWKFNIATKQFIWSAETYRILGIPIGKPVTQKSFYSRIHPDDYHQVQDMWNLALKGDPFDCHHRIVVKQEVFWVHLRAEILFAEDGSPLSVLGTIQDITKTHQISESLRHSEERLSYALQAASEGLWDFNIETNAVYYSPRWMEIVGYHPNELPPSLDTWSMLVHPDEKDKALSQLSDYLAGRSNKYEAEFRMRHKDGHWVHVLSRGILARDDQGNPLSPQRVIGTHLEITEQKQAENQLRESETRYRTLFEGSYDAMIIFRASPLQLITCNSAALEMFDIPDLETFVSLGPLDLVPERQSDQALSQDKLQKIAELVMHNGFHYFEWAHKRLHGDIFPTTVMLSRSEINGELCLQATVRDITQQKNAEEQLRLAASVFAHAREGIMIMNADSILIDVNAAFTYITGYERDEVIGKKPNILKSDRHNRDFYTEMYRSANSKGHWYGEIWNRRKNGELFAALLNISQICSEDGGTRHLVGIFTDITYIKTHQRELEHLAHYDILTGLPNRALLTIRLQQAMALTKRLNKFIAVVFIDLDGFKAINDQYGHEAGDKLLINIAKNMQDSFRKVDTLARIGGDEFIAVFQNLNTRNDCEPFVRRILDSVTKPIVINDETLNITASVGISLYPQDEDASPDLLLRQADQAMYEAKLAGKNRFHFFDSAHDKLIRSHNLNLERIKLALDRQEFVLYYQPKINLRTGHAFGVEALIRWRHPENGLLAPASFLPELENHPLDIELGEWVIETALTQIETWQTMGINMQISVNVGARQLQQPDFFTKLSACLANHPHVQPQQLELEVLETSALEDITHVTNIIESCNEIGVGFVLDDFGTGYSSLSYLKRLPIRLIKIDQSFVRDMLKDKEDLAIIKGVLDLASIFHRNVVAEGIETAQQHRLLINLGCELGQGYGIAKPMPAEAFPAWLSTWRPNPSWLSAPVVSHDNLSLLFAKVAHDAGQIPDLVHLHDNQSTLSPIELSDCLLNHWLEGEGRQRFGDTAWHKGVVALHLHTHTLAAQLTKSPADIQHIHYIHAEKRLTTEIEKLFCSAPIKKHPFSY